jgi:glycosyltransferase involved in cell wall biosynthesis/chaperonin cofactor prefoldin
LSKKLSVCMIVKNEAKNIARCLQSVSNIADEMVVVDTGSEDDTKAIAAKHGAMVYDFQWVDDFSKARNYSIDHATGDWILILDGDDEFEKKDGEKLLELINSEDAADIYIFNTVCYIGSKPGSDQIMNVNLRLFRNLPEFRYQGRIHESVAPPSPNTKMKACDITIYHYGYLNSVVNEQNKRERNMRILGQQLKESPENPYFLFCMGNEYFAIADYDKALEYFLSSYAKCHMQDIYVPKLMLRIVMSYEAKGSFGKALEYIEKALNFYPQYTDAEFLRGGIYHKTGNVIKAVSSFERCLQMGEPPSMLNFIIGVGSYRTCQALGSIYHQLGDLHEALNYYNKALVHKNDLYDAVYSIGSLLTRIYREPEEIKAHLASYFHQNSPQGYVMMADIMFLEHKYQLALEYIEEAAKLGADTTALQFLKAKSLFNLQRYKEAAQELRNIGKQEKYYFNSRTMLVLCLYVQNKFKQTKTVLTEIGRLPEHKKAYKVLLTLGSILQGQPKEPFSEDIEESKDYTALIFDILEVLLCAGEYDVFEKALELLNCVNDREVLLRLAKLYNKYGFIKQAAKEIKRSITAFDLLDHEAAQILQRSFSFGID